MNLRHVPDSHAPPPLILAATRIEAERIAAGLGIEAHIRGIGSPGRGCIASGILVDAAIWPLSDEQLATALPCIAGQPHSGVYRIDQMT